MPSPTPAATSRRAEPRYPQVRVRVSGDGDRHILIGRVAVALRRRVGDAAATPSTPPPTAATATNRSSPWSGPPSAPGNRNQSAGAGRGSGPPPPIRCG
jgi:hypothetical protein